MKKIFSFEFIIESRQGERVRRFYLPVRRVDYSYAYECWLFPLAPFVLLYYIFTRALLSIWNDLMEQYKDLQTWYHDRTEKQ